MSHNAPNPYSPPPQQVVHHIHHGSPKSGAVAALLELLPGLFCGTFGIGHIYAGNVGVGLLFMFGFWIVTAINGALMLVLIGFVTLPLCWVGFLILSPILAAKAAENG